jgi:hypothetical protein
MMMIKTGSVVLLLSLFAVIAPAKAEPHAVAVLQTLDKVTARVNTIDVRVGGTVRFGTLLIRVDHCDKRPPEETPESTAFLLTFAGWMFASSPALNALEHPVYDVWLLDCKERLSDAN